MSNAISTNVVSAESTNDSMVSVFDNAEFGSIRTVEMNGEILFCGKDIATALGYKDTVNALKQHCKSDEVVNRHPITDSLGRTQQARFITEGDVYRLIAHSKLETAQRFELWVFDEVLPSLRKTGKYEIKQPEHKHYQPSEYEIDQLQIKKAELWKSLGDDYTGKSENFKNICYTKSANTLANENLLPLPITEKKTYSATEAGIIVGKRLNMDKSVPAMMIGRCANDLGLKRENIDGLVYHDVNHGRECDTFRYYEETIDIIADKYPTWYKHRNEK